MVDSVSVRFKNARAHVEKIPLNIHTHAGTACVSECVLKTLGCRGLRVGPSKIPRQNAKITFQGHGTGKIAKLAWRAPRV